MVDDERVRDLAPEHDSPPPEAEMGRQDSRPHDDIDGALLWSSMDLPGMDRADEYE